MGGGVGRVGGVVVAVVARLRIRSYLQTAFEPLAALVTLSLISHTPVASGCFTCDVWCERTVGQALVVE